jgi:hypothetical protein
MAKTFSLSDTGLSSGTGISRGSGLSFSGVGGGDTWAGKRFSIGGGGSGGNGGWSVSVERITRTGLPEDVLQRLRAKKPPVDDSGEADLRWGKASNFTLTESKDNQPTNPSYKVNFPGSGGVTDPEVPPEAQVFDFQEYGRAVEVVRVENPDDSEQWVDVERINVIVFLGPDGNYWRYTLKHGDA